MPKTTPFDPAEYLDDPESLAAYLESALEDGDVEDFLDALGIVARAKGMTQIAKEIGVTRPALYRSISASGSPEFATVRHVIQALGVRLAVAPARPRRKPRKTMAAKREKAA